MSPSSIDDVQATRTARIRSNEPATANSPKAGPDALQRLAESVLIDLKKEHPREEVALNEVEEICATILNFSDMRSRVFCWLGMHRDKLPPDAVSALQNLLDPK